MKIFVDTNVILDILLEREPFSEDSCVVWDAVENRDFEGFVSSVSVQNIYFLVKKYKGRQVAVQTIEIVLGIFEILSVDKLTFLNALKYDFADYEDSVIESSAIEHSLNAIITRNTKDFKNSVLEIFTPTDFKLKYLL